MIVLKSILIASHVTTQLLLFVTLVETHLSHQLISSHVFLKLLTVLLSKQPLNHNAALAIQDILWTLLIFAMHVRLLMPLVQPAIWHQEIFTFVIPALGLKFHR